MGKMAHSTGERFINLGATGGDSFLQVQTTDGSTSFKVDAKGVAKVGSQRALVTVRTENNGSIQHGGSPLTATDSTGAGATIDIAAHDVILDFSTVAYPSGSIGVANNDTTYHVFRDDPDYTGAGSYVAKIDGTVGFYDYATDEAGRYYVGKVTTPPDGGGTSTGEAGGGGQF